MKMIILNNLLSQKDIDTNSPAFNKGTSISTDHLRMVMLQPIGKDFNNVFVQYITT